MSPGRAMAAGALLLFSACAGDPSATPGSATAAGEIGGCADVIDVTVSSVEDGSFRFDVTVRSADTGWDKYADRWEIRTPDGTVLAVRELTHPHVDEQPFTRSLAAPLPESVGTVVIAARDSVVAFCGQTRTVNLPR